MDVRGHIEMETLLEIAAIQAADIGPTTEGH